MKKIVRTITITVAIIAILILVLMPKEQHLGSTTRIDQHYLAEITIKRQQWFSTEAVLPDNRRPGVASALNLTA